MCFIQSYTKVIKMNFLLGIQLPRTEKNFFFPINHKNKTKREHQQSKTIPKYPGQKIKYLLIYHSETQRDGWGRGGKCCEVQWLKGRSGDTVLRGGDPGFGEEIPAAPAGTAPHTLGPFIGVYVVGKRQGTDCHDRLTKLMVGLLGS